MDHLIPKPVHMESSTGHFELTNAASVAVNPPSPELMRIGELVAELMRPATGFALPVRPLGTDQRAGDLYLTVTDSEPDLGDEGYDLRVSPDAVHLTAFQPAGLVRGTQSIRQLLPHTIEHRMPQPGPWLIPAMTIRDYPRFAWRGMMLDVARHFFTVAEVKRCIDLAAFYKLNRFHLHLTDDQGWRLEIKSWPELVRTGGRTQVGGGPGGYYTQEEYAELVAYAQDRCITLVPEIDVPGHTNAALAAYPELNCDGRSPELYTGVEVGFSTLCLEREVVYRFMDDVIGEVAALTPGPYLHIGGDEAHSTKLEVYRPFIARVLEIVAAHGKTAVGWEEIGQATLRPGTLAQHWASGHILKAVEQGAMAILSPSTHAYLDMKYDETTPIGLTWAGTIDVRVAYEWDPANLLPGISEADLAGIESPLWTETVETWDDITFMTLPRLAGHAEIGWSPAAGRHWEEYRNRLAEHHHRWDATGLKYYRARGVSEQVT